MIFPTSHYHGITVTIDFAGITEEMRKILELLSVDLTRILALLLMLTELDFDAGKADYAY